MWNIWMISPGNFPNTSFILYNIWNTRLRMEIIAWVCSLFLPWVWAHILSIINNNCPPESFTSIFSHRDERVCVWVCVCMLMYVQVCELRGQRLTWTSSISLHFGFCTKFSHWTQVSAIRLEKPGSKHQGFSSLSYPASRLQHTLPRLPTQKDDGTLTPCPMLAGQGLPAVMTAVSPSLNLFLWDSPRGVALHIWNVSVPNSDPCTKMKRLHFHFHELFFLCVFDSFPSHTVHRSVW